MFILHDDMKRKYTLQFESLVGSLYNLFRHRKTHNLSASWYGYNGQGHKKRLVCVCVCVWAGGGVEGSTEWTNIDMYLEPTTQANENIYTDKEWEGVCVCMCVGGGTPASTFLMD